MLFYLKKIKINRSAEVCQPFIVLVFQTNGSCYPAAFIQFFYSTWCQYFFFFFQKENVGGDPNADFSVGRTGSIILEFLILSSTIG